jgi:predicted AAA+ superfamily ATPase
MTVSSRLDTVSQILEIASTWSFWTREPPTSVPRDIDLPPRLTDTVSLVIQGVRRCGKSTLLQQLLGRYDLNPRHCAFVNFEDPRLSRESTFETLGRLVDDFREAHPEAKQLYFFLDEIQAVDGWQRWLRSRLDRPRGDIFVITGSNGRLLSGEMGSTLTGRHLTVELYPFDLFERRKLGPTRVEDYLMDGGFPEPLTRSDGDRLRRQYFHDIVERDLRERLRARSSLPIRQVVQMAFESAGSEMSLRRFAGATGLAVDTTRAYLEAAEAAYLLFSCPYFAFSERKRASRNRKYYPVDTGLRRVVVTRTGEDLGKSLECAVHLLLRRRFGRVSYWRDRGEVDFVVQDRGRIIPVQVSWEGPTDRHHRAMADFYERFPQAEETVFVTAENFAAAAKSWDPRSA